MLLAASGLLMVAAAAERWLPSCGLGSFDIEACLRMQSHAYAFGTPREPWVAVGQALELHGFGLLLLAAAVVLLPTVLTGRRPGGLISAAAWVVAVGVAAVGTTTWLSGMAAAVVTVPGLWVGAVLWLVGLPALVICVAATASPARGGVEAGRWAVVALVLASHPVVDLVLTPLLVGYVSHDVTPWTGAMSGLLLVAAGVAVWLLARGQRSSTAQEIASGDNSSRLRDVTLG
jgi:hypothetical protein